MKQTYFISQTHSITSDEAGSFSEQDLNLALVHIAGWQLREYTPLGEAIIARPGATPDGKEIFAFIPNTTDAEQIEKLAKTYNLTPISPLNNNEFAQALLAHFPCVISDIKSVNGRLVGGWRVESLGVWGGADIVATGVRHGPNEYVETFSHTLAEAVGLNVLNRCGLGKKAYFSYPVMTVDNGELIYLSARTLSQISHDERYMSYLVAAPELDSYAMVQAPEDVINDARVLADAQAVLNKAKLKADQDEAARKEAELAAPVPGEVGPESFGTELGPNVVEPEIVTEATSAEPVEGEPTDADK